MLKRWLASLAAGAALLLALSAGADVAVPPLRARVTDLTRTLSPSQVETLESRLRDFEQRKGSQVAVLVLPSTEPETIEQYSIRVADAWRIGRAGVGDGVIVVVAKEDRAIRIEVGRGLEGAIPDAIAKRIGSDVMAPYFRQGDFYGGIAAGSEAVMKLIAGEPLPAVAPAPAFDGNALIIAIAGLMFASSLLGRIFGRTLGAVMGGVVAGVIVWVLAGSLAFAFVAGLIGHSRSTGLPRSAVDITSA